MPSLPARIGRYEIVDRLGEGGMGVVYLARDPQLERTVAIKMLSAQGDSEYHHELRQRFAREASSAASLKHNHIVTIYDVGEDAGRPFIAMEFLDGESMAQIIQRGAPLDVEHKVRLALELCAGLGYAHRRGIIHRDIKPANLMVTGEGVLKVLDFGLARAMASAANAELTQAGTLLGTPHYMSPEQILGKPVDHRSDIFAVGAVLYELFTCRKAFQAGAPSLVLLEIVKSEPTPICDLVPGFAPDLERAIAKAIHKDPEHRYQSLDALASDLRQIVHSSAALDAATIRMPSPVPGVVVVPADIGRLAPAAPAATSAALDATLVVPAAQPERIETPSPAVATRRGPLVVALVMVVAALVAVALYAVLARGRSPEGVAGPAPSPAVAPSTNGAGRASETTSGSSAAQPAQPDQRVPEAAAPSAPVAAPLAPVAAPPSPVATTPTVAPRVPPAAASAAVGASRGVRTEPPVARSTPPAVEAAPAVAPPKPVSGARGAPRTAEVTARCNQLVERASLGEALTTVERDFLAQQCRN